MAAKHQEHKGHMTVEEAGRKGGKKVAQERGSEFYSAIGQKGGEIGGHHVRELIDKGKAQEQHDKDKHEHRDKEKKKNA